MSALASFLATFTGDALSTPGKPVGTVGTVGTYRNINALAVPSGSKSERRFGTDNPLKSLPVPTVPTVPSQNQGVESKQVVKNEGLAQGLPSAAIERDCIIFDAPSEGVPPAYSAALSALQSACPAGIPADRHRQAMADGAAFLERWGAEAERLGWSVAGVFGLHPIDGASDRKSMGLVWWLEGGTVTALEAGFATIMQPNGLPAYLAFP